MYSIAFNAAFENTIGLEGGYSNDPDDLGGETKFGISHKSYPFIDIKELTADMAKQIYHRDFWMRLRLDELRGDIATEIFDTAVNMGRKVAVEFAQRACNYLGTSLVVDGLIGNHTIAALRNPIFRVSDLLKILNALQLSRYVSLVEENPKQQKYALGWLKRVVIK